MRASLTEKLLWTLAVAGAITTVVTAGVLGVHSNAFTISGFATGVFLMLVTLKWIKREDICCSERLSFTSERSVELVRRDPRQSESLQRRFELSQPLLSRSAASVTTK